MKKGNFRKKHKHILDLTNKKGKADVTEKTTTLIFI